MKLIHWITKQEPFNYCGSTVFVLWNCENDWKERFFSFNNSAKKAFFHLHSTYFDKDSKTWYASSTWCEKLEAIRYLSMVEIYAEHRQLLGIFQEVHLCFRRRHPPDGANKKEEQTYTWVRCFLTSGLHDSVTLKIWKDLQQVNSNEGH